MRAELLTQKVDSNDGTRDQGEQHNTRHTAQQLVTTPCNNIEQMEYRENFEISEFVILKYVAQGLHGIVFKAKHTSTNTTCALKFISLFDIFTNEVNALRKFIDNPQVVQIYGWGMQALDSAEFRAAIKDLSAVNIEPGKYPRHFIVLGWLEGVTVFENLANPWFTFEQRRIVAKQFLQAMLNIHNKGVLQGDVRTSNLILTTRKGGPCLVVFDFGHAKEHIASAVIKTEIIQCGGVLLALFCNIQEVDSRLARKFIPSDIKSLILQFMHVDNNSAISTALEDPCLNSPHDTRTIFPSLPRDLEYEILQHLVSSSTQVRDIINCKLVCKHLFHAIDSYILTSPNLLWPTPSTPSSMGLSEKEIDKCSQLPVADLLKWIDKTKNFNNYSFAALFMYCGNDVNFFQELLEEYTMSLVNHTQTLVDEIPKLKLYVDSKAWRAMQFSYYLLRDGTYYIGWSPICDLAHVGEKICKETEPRSQQDFDERKIVMQSLLDAIVHCGQEFNCTSMIFKQTIRNESILKKLEEVYKPTQT